MPRPDITYQSRDDLFSLIITLIIDIFKSHRKHLPELNDKFISFTLAILQYIIGKIQKRNFLGHLRAMELLIPRCYDHVCFAPVKYTPV